MNHKLILCLIVLTAITNAGHVRFLQNYNDPGCSQWNFDGTQCLKCAPRTYNNTQLKRCIQVDDNCKTFDQSNGQCLTCYDGYGTSFKNGQAINGKCPFFNQYNQNTTQLNIYCQCFDQNRTCLYCFPGYALDQQGMCVLSNLSNCKAIMNQTCIQCDTGYYLDMQNLCVQLPANCTQVNDNGTCIQCQVGLVLTQQGECIELLVSISPFCQVAAKRGQCLKCFVGYYICQNGRCKKIMMRGCEQADANGLCTLCKEGYFLNTDGECEKLPEFCNQADQNGICISCQPGYYLDNEKMCMILPEACQNASAQGKCILCMEGFIVSQGRCKAKFINETINPDCAQQNQMGQCTKCRQFYKLVNGSCIPTGQNPFCKPGACECGTGDCLQCIQGYFLDNNAICIQISQNCANYSLQTGKCTQCLDGFQFILGQCIPIRVNQTLNNLTNLNCKQQDQQGNCISCRKYYDFINSTCIPTGKNPKCRMYDDEHKCICCYYPYKYYLDYNHICVPKHSNCLQFDIQTGECTECFAEDTLEDGECIESKENISKQSKKKKK